VLFGAVFEAELNLSLAAFVRAPFNPRRKYLKCRCERNRQAKMRGEFTPQNPHKRLACSKIQTRGKFTPKRPSAKFSLNLEPNLFLIKG